MKFYRYLPALTFLLLLGVNLAVAADQNGYTAQYECRAGNPGCNVNLTELTTQACEQVISPTDRDWNKIYSNSGQRVFCISPGDHSNKGPLTLSFSGSSSARKVLRYFDTNDSGAEPWSQNNSNRAVVNRLVINGASYWLVHRIAVQGNSRTYGIEFVRDSGASANILNRVLVSGYDASLIQLHQGNANNTIQNSVIHSSVVGPYENNCIELGGSPGTWVTNNEIYNCNKAISSGSGNSNIIGVKIENNDLYVNSQIYSDCRGRYLPGDVNAPCAANEAIISLKAGGNAQNPVRIVHNRIWGARAGDATLLGGVNSGEAPSISVSADCGYVGNSLVCSNGGADYVLIQNNIIGDAQAGVANWWGYPEHISLVGNIIYDIRRRDTASPAYALRLYRTPNTEVYLNSIVNSQGAWLLLGGESSESDVRCNVVMNSSGFEGAAASSTVIENNAFYNTTPYSANGNTPNISFSGVDDALQTEFCFKRKLRTAAETICIPHIKPTMATPHRTACTTRPGSRLNIGIDNHPL